MREYTPGFVWSVLAGTAQDPDAAVDVVVALKKLDHAKEMFLLLHASGQSARDAMEKTGLRGNQTRLKQSILQELTEIINGKEDSVDIHRTHER